MTRLQPLAEIAQRRDDQMWQQVAAKFAYMLMDHDSPELSEEQKERGAAGLLAAAFDLEQKAAHG